MKKIVVIGATGDVGRGIVAELLPAGHQVVAVARDAGRLAALVAEFALAAPAAGDSATLSTLVGSVATDASAAELLAAIRAVHGTPAAVIVSINSARRPQPLSDYDTGQFASLIGGDLFSHFTAAHCFIPALSAGGTYIGIGGGSCDFVLHDGVPQSVAQAALRMLYRGLAHEHRDSPVHIRELIVASVVNGVSTRAFADPSWVTEREIGAQVAAIVAAPEQYPAPILRLARRDATGLPAFSLEAPSRVQGFRQPTAS